MGGGGTWRSQYIPLHLDLHQGRATTMPLNNSCSSEGCFHEQRTACDFRATELTFHILIIHHPVFRSWAQAGIPIPGMSLAS